MTSMLHRDDAVGLYRGMRLEIFSNVLQGQAVAVMPIMCASYSSHYRRSDNGHTPGVTGSAPTLVEREAFPSSQAV